MVNFKKSRMLRFDTPVENYTKEYGLWVKREDRSCRKPGPQFSKARGVYARIESRPEKLIGVLDTAHSQAGHAVARACQILGKRCINYYPLYKADTELRRPQIDSKALGARLEPLPAGRSCILFHAAKKHVEKRRGYMMPNALKLEESVEETAIEVGRYGGEEDFEQVLIPISSGTIAAGVIKGFLNHNWEGKFIIHLGYSRSHDQVVKYLKKMSGYEDLNLKLIDEGFTYKDKAKGDVVPPWPCNVYYDLKAFQWWLENRNNNNTLFWNIG